MIQVIADPQPGTCNVVAEGDLVYCTSRGDVLVAIGEEDVVEQVPTERECGSGDVRTINVPHVVKRVFFVIRTGQDTVLADAQYAVRQAREELSNTRFELSEQTKRYVLCSNKNEQLEKNIASSQKELEQAKSIYSDLEVQLAEATLSLELVRKAIGDLQFAKLLKCKNTP